MNRLDEILKSVVCDNCDKPCEESLSEAKTKILALFRETLPKPTRAHTYASENADIYEAFDRGWNNCIKHIESKLKELQ